MNQRDAFFRKIGQAEMSHAIGKLGEFAKLQILKEIQETKAYQGIEGLHTMDDVIEAMGLGKSTAYHGLKAIKTLGEEPVRLLMGMGVPIHQTYLLSRGIEGRQVEFEVVNLAEGEFKIDGKVISTTKDPEEFGTILTNALNGLNSAKKQMNDLAAKTQKQDEEIAKLKEKIEAGEKQAQKHSGMDKYFTDIAMCFEAMIDQVRKIMHLEMTEIDEQRKAEYLGWLRDDIETPLRNKLEISDEEAEAIEDAEVI